MTKPPKQSRSLAPIGDYDVGYCKPPLASQFKVGQPSANPSGRPKGSGNRTKANPLPLLDVSVHNMILGEAMRPVQVRDGDRVVKVPAIQAGARATFLNAARGSNPAMRTAHLITTSAQAALDDAYLKAVETWADYKVKALDRLHHCKSRGIRYDWLVHPDDVQFDPRTGKLEISGPLNLEEWEAQECLLDDIDFLFERAEALAASIRSNPRLKRERKSLGSSLELIRRINAVLRPHWQRKIDPEMSKLAIAWDGLEPSDI